MKDDILNVKCLRLVHCMAYLYTLQAFREIRGSNDSDFKMKFFAKPSSPPRNDVSLSSVMQCMYVPSRMEAF